MKKLISIFLMIAITAFGSACSKTTVVVKTTPKKTTKSTMPPGQAKKAAGTKSAKQFAPGQQKKN